MSALLPRGPGTVAKRDGALVGELSYRADGKKPAQRTLAPPAPAFDSPLAAWFAAASDGDEVEIYVDVDANGVAVQARMADPPLLVSIASDPERLAAVDRLGGGANPYTFVPTPPRVADDTWQLEDDLIDGSGPSHAVIDVRSQWMGRLVLRMTAVTPLLLPDLDSPSAQRDSEDHPTYPVRVGSDGLPLIHGASLKGALRTAYETVTASRFGVFRGHEQALAYRLPVSKEDQRPAARVEDDGQGGRIFRICQPYPVPLYDPPERSGRGQSARGPRRKARFVGPPPPAFLDEDGSLNWSAMHGLEVVFTTRESGPPGKGRPIVDTVSLPESSQAGRRGWLSVTGRSIETKSSERLFVRKNQPPITVLDEHDKAWRDVLVSYHDAAQYNDPGEDTAGKQLDRSQHVKADGDRPDRVRLQPGDLVYLDVDKRGRVTAVHPVMFGRLPFSGPPADLLDRSLQPPSRRAEMSPADRLFGWARQTSPEDSPAWQTDSSGYRGRVRFGQVRCTTPDWLVKHEPGVTVAASGTPKPTQFRFYAAADQTGARHESRAPKSDGYRSGTGLRGRKAYWYPNNATADYWTPGDPDATGGNRTQAGRHREWQATKDAKRSQTATHLGWVRPGAEFTVELFLDAVPSSELGPLLWLLQQDGCALRLGAGKPHGFGAVRVAVDWEATELRTGESLKQSWLSLRRPPATPAQQARDLADEFGTYAEADDYLGPIIAAWRKIAAGLDVPIHYPRTQKSPEAETYRWFVANEQIVSKRASHGIALPHVLEGDQRLPYLPPARAGDT